METACEQVQNVINLSKTPLSNDCVNALSKGLSFVPTVHCNNFDTIVDFHKFFRTLRLKEFFNTTPLTGSLTTPLQPATVENDSPSQEVTGEDATTTTRAITPFRGKSTFIPPKKRNASLDTYCRLVEKDVTLLLSKKYEYKVADNLTQAQRKELKALQSNKMVVIQSADKGGAIVIMDRTSYEEEIKRQLSNTTFYKKLKQNPTVEFKKKIKNQLDDFLNNNDITKREHAFMTTDSPTIPVLYTLPKIHKQFTDIPPGRPIVASIGSLTENISAFVDYFLQPLVTSLPSYVKDSMEFLKMIQTIEIQEEQCYLVTMDIESLYTNVPFEGGLKATEFFLNQRSDSTPRTQCIVDLIEIVLRSNYFLFGSDFYLQVSGTSMGSKMAPSFASLFVGHFEKKFIWDNHRNPYLQYITNWKRYIDDIWFLWRGSEAQLQQFHTYVNNAGPHLNFTMEYDAQKMNFLDITVYRDSHRLSTTLYRKKTDRNSILHGQSYHPTPLKRSLPISQFNRIRRICSTDENFEVQAKDLEQRFSQRQYKSQWVSSARDRFHGMSQSDCLQTRRQDRAEPNLMCVIQYSPLAKQFESVINKHWHIIASDPALSVFTSPPKVVFKRPPNLRNMLVRAHHSPQTQHFLRQTPSGNYKCNNCTQCNFTHKTKVFNHPRTGKEFKIRGTISCNTTNVIYMLKCPCGLAYIGKTTRALKTRIAEHRSTIRNHDKKSPVAEHFTQFGHSVASLRYIGIERIQPPSRGGDVNSILLKREALWIYTLDTLSPKGLNEDFDLRPFL